jgi:hypothetical protein
MDIGTSSYHRVPHGERTHRETTTRKLNCYVSRFQVNLWLAVVIPVIVRATVMSAVEQTCIGSGPNNRRTNVQSLEYD